MCTTATDSPRPCDRCDSGIATGTGTKDAHGQTEWLCSGCVKRLSEPEYKDEPGEHGFDNWAAAGYGEPDDDSDFLPNADGEMPYGDDEEYTHPDFSE